MGAALVLVGFEAAGRAEGARAAESVTGAGLTQTRWPFPESVRRPASAMTKTCLVVCGLEFGVAGRHRGSTFGVGHLSLQAGDAARHILLFIGERRRRGRARGDGFVRRRHLGAVLLGQEFRRDFRLRSVEGLGRAMTGPGP